MYDGGSVPNDGPGPNNKGRDWKDENGPGAVARVVMRNVLLGRLTCMWLLVVSLLSSGAGRRSVWCLVLQRPVRGARTLRCRPMVLKIEWLDS